ncbi:MAG TPA: hypothetical protein VKB88_17640 [Bryobacteraceae bacterium]|nr:hypothetical protein [Bryobacteraceae bacterium]
MTISRCLVGLSLIPLAGYAQGRQQAPGHPIGKIATQDNLIVMTLDEGVLGKAKLFDLGGRTVRFTRGGTGYQIENAPLHWDSEFGEEMSGSEASLHKFAFPFSGRDWDSLSIGITGSIAFGEQPPGAGRGGRGGRGGGVSVDRFAQLQRAGRTLINTVPAICVFFKPRMSGKRYWKELDDRAVITWSLTEPVGGIQDFTWAPTVNRFQAVLHKNGTIEMSYQEVAAKDAIVGVYPMVTDAQKEAAVEIDLAHVKPQDGPFPLAYEAFHYLTLPNPRDLSCTVIRALGDKFDFLVYYSDFRVDNQEAGTPSTGPLGGGPSGGAVTGIGAQQRGLDAYCTQGRFQWQFIQPVYIGSNQGRERPPEGITDNNTHNIAHYAHEIGERTPDGKILPYDYAMSQIGHELGHRWSAFASAKVNSETIPLGPTHWARGLQAPAPFPYQRPTEASAMGGGVWQDNFDGTFTQLDDDYYVPATGYSYLDLYLMGMIAPSEVPDFFILRNLVPAGTDRNGHPIFKADRTKVTIEDVIAVHGPRLPDVDHAQKQFNTGMVVVVEHGAKPSRELIERTEAIRGRWIDYWETVTGHRSFMTASPK